MSHKEEPLIIASDFESIKLQINLVNVTAQTEIRDGKRCYSSGINNNKNSDADENLVILISEFLENGLALEVPSKTCAMNHSVIVEISTLNSSAELKITANFKVKSVEKLSADSDLIIINFVQKNEKDWDALQNVFNQRQDEIRNFINSVKGYEST